MKNVYNQWYWKLYRWFKWDAKHLHRDIIQGFKNLWRWFPLVWKDRDWDDFFIFEPLKFKINKTANYIEKNKRFVGWETEVRYMRICEKLIDYVLNEYYQMEPLDYFDYDINFVPVEGQDLYEMKSKTTRDNLKSYIQKYPRTRRIVLKNPKYKSYYKNKKGLAIAMGIERHNKARKLLFKILEERIERWWD